jgi:ABC-2 type transport system permease protein
MCVLCSTTTSSISIEGKQWWIIKSLPVKTKLVCDSKILVNLTIALPCYIASTCLLCLAVRMNAAGYLWLFLLPFIYVMFSSVLGLAINLKMPMFQWESEVVIVKQGAAVLISMFIGFVSIVVPWVLLVVLPSALQNIVWPLTTVAIAVATVLLYQKNNKIVLKKID